MKLAPTTIANTNRVLRACQLVACAVALGRTVSSFGATESNGYSYRLGSPSTTLHILTTYTAFMYATWFVVCVELLALAPRPRLATMRLLDGVNAATLLIAGMLFKNSDYVRHCGIYGSMLKCGGFDTAVAFTVVAIVLFVASLALTCVKCSQNGLEIPPVGYMVETTPTAAAVQSPQSKVANAPTPSAKV